MKNINLNTMKIVTLITMTTVIIATSVTVAVGCQNGMFNFENEETTLETEIVTEVEESLEERYAAVFAWQTSASDFGTEQLYFLKEQCDKYEIPMEIMLSIICTESSFRSYIVSKSNTGAAGYCQITTNAAEWVYESLLKYGKYDTNNHVNTMTTDWRLNIEMGCRIIYCWYWNSNESWESAVKRYYGSSTDEYLNTVNNHMTELFGMTVADFE